MFWHGTEISVFLMAIAFLNVTTSEKKNGYLLIEAFGKLFNTQTNGHLGSILGGLS